MKRLNLMIDEETLELLRRAAEAKHETVSNYLRRLIRQHILEERQYENYLQRREEKEAAGDGDVTIRVTFAKTYDPATGEVSGYPTDCIIFRNLESFEFVTIDVDEQNATAVELWDYTIERRYQPSFERLLDSSPEVLSYTAVAGAAKARN